MKNKQRKWIEEGCKTKFEVAEKWVKERVWQDDPGCSSKRK